MHNLKTLRLCHVPIIEPMKAAWREQARKEWSDVLKRVRCCLFLGFFLSGCKHSHPEMCLIGVQCMGDQVSRRTVPYGAHVCT